MKLFNGWNLYVSYSGEHLRTDYCKRFSIMLTKKRQYIPSLLDDKTYKEFKAEKAIGTIFNTIDHNVLIDMTDRAPSEMISE